MFNKRLKLFQEHWASSLNDLRREAEGLLEWFQVLENHAPTQLSSGELQDRYNSIVAVFNTLEAQQHFLPDQPASCRLLAEVKSVLEMVEEAQIGEKQSAQQKTSSSPAASGSVSIDDIVNRSVMTTHDVNKVLDLSYSTFIKQVADQPLEAKRYAYCALIREFIIEIQNQRIYNFRYLSDLADDLHNIPGFMAGNFQRFDDDYFWDSIFNKHTEATYFIVKTFLSGLSGYYAWLKKTGPYNELSKPEDLSNVSE
jgi:hypothetical protein